MTEQINDQISAFIDDELPDEESAFLLRRFERDPDARGRALRYTVIGAALRNELLGPDPAILRRRIAVALTGAPPLPAQRVPAPWHSRYLRPLVGVGIAASVAVGAISGLRALTDARLGTVAPAGTPSATPLQTRAPDAPPSYVVPQEVADAPAVTPAVRLTNYVVHHSEYTSGLSRTFVRSNVVGAAEILPAAEPPPQQPPPELRQATTPE
ncbi:MAG TPA: sigma-E factor negative regulatory protein [Gammaproteobacteria bacterium]|nr:sigma-E factor negative regulatory protein [Gammaproteobacteria bacterium]